MTKLLTLLQKAESSLVEKLSKHNTDIDALLNRANNDKLVFDTVDEVCKEVVPTEDDDLIQTLVSCPDLLREHSFTTDFPTISDHLRHVIDNCIAALLFDFLLEEYGFTVDSYEEDEETPPLKVLLRDEKFGRTQFYVEEVNGNRAVTALAAHDADFVKDNKGYILHIQDCQTMDEAIEKMKWLGLFGITELR